MISSNLTSTKPSMKVEINAPMLSIKKSLLGVIGIGFFILYAVFFNLVLLQTKDIIIVATIYNS